MNVTRTLTFQWTTGSLIFSVAVVLATMLFSFIAWQRSQYRASIGMLESLRILIVLFAAVLFNQPEWIEEFHPDEKSQLAVLVDATQSMETRDVIRSGSLGTPATSTAAAAATDATGSVRAPLSRREAIADLTTESSWDAVKRKNTEVSLERIITDNGPAGGTDLAAPMLAALEKYKNLRAMVLISDGDWNIGMPPAAAAAILRQKNIPVFVMPVGSRTRLPDVELVSVDVPTFAVAGKTVRIPFSIDSSLPRDYQTIVRLKGSDGSEVQRDVKIQAMNRTTDAIIWKPPATGDFTVTLTVPKHSEEILANNNAQMAPISIRQEKLKVLVVESYPRWEYRYLRNALSRDPGVEVSCLLFHPGLGKVGGGNKDYIKSFPEAPDQLTKYDVVFLGDVGVEQGQLTTHQCEMLRGLVERQASGLVFMPGWQGRELSLMDSPLGDLCPVQMDPAQPGGWGSRTPGHFELTEQGRRSLLTKLADTADDNIDVWQKLPGFQWYAPIVRAKAGTEVLCTHGGVSNEFGHIPLLVTRTFGAGKVLFMGTDGAWRWRKGVEDKYHYRFWGQVVRWMAYQRNMSKGSNMRFFHTPDQPQTRQTISLTAHVMENTGEPLQNGEVSVRVTAPSGKGETIRLSSTGDEWGVYTGQLAVDEPGKHTAVLTCKQTKASLESTIFIQGGLTERVGRAARPDVLEEIARVTRGKVFSVEKPEDLMKVLSAIPEPPPAIRRLPLWSHPLAAGVVVLLLGGFWIARKGAGLV